jgi:hypothetical protein
VRFGDVVERIGRETGLCCEGLEERESRAGQGMSGV